MPSRYRFPAALLAAALPMVLAGCDALLPVTSTPIPEQPNYGQLPGPGTYHVMADDAPSAATPPDGPPVRDADGPREGLAAPRTGADTLGTGPMAAPDVRAVEGALARALERRGYRPRPAARAAWHVRYRTVVENRDENLAPRDKLLQPRLRCDLQGCMVTHQWEHFGPPDRADPLRRYQVGVVQVDIRNARDGAVVWQGRLTSELDETGTLNASALDQATRRLVKELPRAPRRNPLPEPGPEDASGAANAAEPASASRR